MALTLVKFCIDETILLNMMMVQSTNLRVNCQLITCFEAMMWSPCCKVSITAFAAAMPETKVILKNIFSSIRILKFNSV
jgi:hypothetical protein